MSFFETFGNIDFIDFKDFLLTPFGMPKTKAEIGVELFFLYIVNHMCGCQHQIGRQKNPSSNYIFISFSRLDHPYQLMRGDTHFFIWNVILQLVVINPKVFFEFAKPLELMLTHSQPITQAHYSGYLKHFTLPINDFLAKLLDGIQCYQLPTIDRYFLTFLFGYPPRVDSNHTELIVFVKSYDWSSTLSLES